MSRKAYSTDITDAEWELLQSLIPPIKTGGRPRTVDMREIINAILYIQNSGCSWRLLPHDLPPWPTVYHYFRTWRRSGVWKNMNQALKRRKNKIL
ncbi:MAG: transposase [Mojavia pulchra JT2-VF2]|jgi:putative transposase|uniref:Transposase n=1 Tax=Mojavia pulchra JT2-VF2 TaxID=287848 RepID=A0A951Q027_9NOST|nr:transposase [Mojavia pulchra JT2-VF2]